MPKYELIQGDCLEVMKSLESGSVDLILTDPPYQLNNWTNPMKWDTVIDLSQVWPVLDRVLSSQTRAVLLFGSEPYSTTQRNSNPTKFKYDLVWVKNKVTAPMLAKVRPLKSFELVSVFSSGKTSPGREGNMVYFPQGLRPIEKVVKNNKKSRSVIQDRPSLFDKYTQEKTGYPRDVLLFDTESGLHPTQKPVALMEYLIRTYSRFGETVLDFTMGSGTTGVAAMNTGRNFIGIERESEYFEIAKRRIEDSAREAEDWESVL